MWEWCRNQQEEEEEEDEEELRGAKTALRCEEYPQFRVEFCPQDDLGDPPCRAPPWGAYCVGGVQKLASEGDLGPRKRLCGVRSTHNFESNPAPKMI